MRLSKVKLSGFKSFVDPTTLNFPTNLTGIVGPNGCGKSNIIDAIRWVLGESSAKTLRGDSMADVIFNGSSTRKPVGQASIELVFDNSDGQITGTYAGYTEVAMRRVVSRDGTSQYFLNNGKCRRKDITNLLLGTGVGSHGYSVIEQGMISRLVEAKPEELRSFLEEAAGISKYKERRRETEHRIEHTKANLERLKDLTDELGNQLDHLQRQAKAAERYSLLKAEERRTEAELLLLRLKSLEGELAEEKRTLAARQHDLDVAVTNQGTIDKQIEQLRVALDDRGDEFNEVQGIYYKVGADIARLEQNIQHRNSDIQRQQKELEQTETQLGKVAGHVTDDEAELEKLDEMLGRLNPELAQAQQQLETLEQSLRHAERDAEAGRDQAEGIAAAIADAERTVQVDGARLEQLGERLERVRIERQDKDDERDSIQSAQLDRAIDGLTAAEEVRRAEYDGATRRLESTTDEIRQLRKEELALSGELDGLRGRLQLDMGRLSSLEALQEAALGQVSEAAAQWLQRGNRSKAPRLAAQLQVEAGWERAVETVVRGYLNALEARTLEELAPDLQHLQDSGLAFIETEQAAPSQAEPQVLLPTLAEKIRSPKAAGALLTGVFAATSLKEALAIRARLLPGQSIVTRDGVEVTAHSLRIGKSDDPQVGVIARSEEIERLQASVTSQSRDAEAMAARAADMRSRIEAAERRLLAEQAAAHQSQGEHAQARAELETRKARREELRQRSAALVADAEALERESQVISQSMADARKRIETATAEREDFALRQARLHRERNDTTDHLQDVRRRAELERERVKEMAILVESRRSSKQTASAALERIQAQKGYLIGRRDELRTHIEALKAPLAEDQITLTEQLDERLKVEDALAQARGGVEACEQQVRDAEAQRVTGQRIANEARDAAEGVRMTVREIEVRADTVREQLGATGFVLDVLLAELPEGANSVDWAERLESVGRKIQRLGPINLAAIDEFQEKSDRKQYLDKQFADLTEALTTLEAAIRKIDGETRARFRDTFNHANQGLGELFPRLFGGGQAYLELESDDLLSAGVTIMARPPGKRISTIHLLSGGEKALTAVALVFAIFKLNPAPFCLLDEVDAPLDDANVGRFSEIVREMSDQVQFVLITHNKTTMEAMNQLAGVTMHEPGVSRLVAVDIDEAVQLAAM
jgi:chromosome segregation protein